MKLAIFACLILTPLASARYLQSLHDNDDSAEVNYRKLPLSKINFEIANRKRDVDDVEVLELKARAESSGHTYGQYLDITERFSKLFDLFQKANLDFGDVLCGEPDETLRKALKTNKDLYVEYEAFNTLTRKYKLDPQYMFCY